MKNALINFKADPADIDRWKAALERDGRTMSEVCRQSLDRIAKRIEKQAGQQLPVNRTPAPPPAA